MIFTNQFIKLTESDKKVYIQTLKKGLSLKEFELILRQHPRIKLSHFALLKNSLLKEMDQPVQIGEWLPFCEIEISKDGMTASIIVHETNNTIQQNGENIKQQIKDVLKENHVIHGIKELDLGRLITGKPYEIAVGTPPLQGNDAKVKYLQIPERKPVIRDDGRADFFDMNFIFEIKEGAWLGEKTPASEGKEGIDIFGNSVAAPSGKDVPIKFDPNSAYEIEEDGKIVIRAKTTGVVEHRQGFISVNRHLPIVGDVGIETGNIQFDGSISIKGTVQNGYSVTANGDISIEGIDGVTGANLIHSIEGDIYIRGGIFGNNETQVVAGGNIYVKHVNDAKLTAGNEIIIGSYSLGSTLKASRILVDERRGKIIGGKAVALNTIVTAIAGNHLERKTELIINNSNKKKALNAIQEKAANLKIIQEEIIQLSTHINPLIQYKKQLTQQQLAVVDEKIQYLNELKNSAEKLDQEIKNLMYDHQQVGKEKIVVKKEAFPGTFIQIGGESSHLTKKQKGTFLIEFGELNV
ncbi:DUF342 domain-containing protein [Ureibacillus sp. NPDC094379]